MTTTTTPGGLAAVRRWSPGRVFALVSAAVYLSAGIIGFAVTGFDTTLTGLADTKVVILAVNPLHNVIHLVLGAAYAVGTLGNRAARHANTAIGAGLLAAFVLGIAGGAEFINIHGVAEPDNWLHLIWGTASVWIGIAKSRA